MYNYEHFPLDGDLQDFVAFCDVARVGTKASDGELIDAADREPVRLSDVFKSKTTVAEFGSLT